MEKKYNLKTLHLSNIANNAYLNAKILNERGIKSDVLSLDYYHIMGCPEWEDADFIGNHYDDFKPNWSRVDLNGFKRPSWFVQARKLDGLRYLIAKNENNFFTKFYYDKKIKIINYLIESENRVARKLVGMIAKNLKKSVLILKRVNTILKNWSKLFYLLFGVLFAISILPIIIYIIFHRKKVSTRIKENKEFFIKRLEELKEKVKIDFPNRFQDLDFNTLVAYEPEVYLLRKLFKYYDKVYAYGVDGIYPLLAGKEYIAFEHGTLRKLPYSNDAIGLQTLLSYKYANCVMITNADNIVSAKKLKLENFIFTPHPVNEEPILKLGDFDSNLFKNKYKTDFLIYHPPRQHWDSEDRDLNYEKGNDIFINGFAKFVKNINPNAKAIFSEWGEMVDKTKELLLELDIVDNIIWMKPVNNYEMIRIIQSVDLVADQFFLGSFGDILPKTCLSKKVTMMYLNEELHKWCFDEMPPVINVSTSEDIYIELEKLYNSQEQLELIGNKSYTWYQKYHSNELIYNKLRSI